MDKIKTIIRNNTGDTFSVEAHTWDIENGWIAFKNWTDVEARKFDRIAMFRESEVEAFYEEGKANPVD